MNIKGVRANLWSQGMKVLFSPLPSTKELIKTGARSNETRKIQRILFYAVVKRRSSTPHM